MSEVEIDGLRNESARTLASTFPRDVKRTIDAIVKGNLDHHNVLYLESPFLSIISSALEIDFSGSPWSQHFAQESTDSGTTALKPVAFGLLRKLKNSAALEQIEVKLSGAKSFILDFLDKSHSFRHLFNLLTSDEACRAYSSTVTIVKPADDRTVAAVPHEAAIEAQVQYVLEKIRGVAPSLANFELVARAIKRGQMSVVSEATAVSDYFNNLDQAYYKCPKKNKQIEMAFKLTLATLINMQLKHAMVEQCTNIAISIRSRLAGSEGQKPKVDSELISAGTAIGIMQNYGRAIAAKKAINQVQEESLGKDSPKADLYISLLLLRTSKLRIYSDHLHDQLAQDIRTRAFKAIGHSNPNELLKLVVQVALAFPEVMPPPQGYQEIFQLANLVKDSRTYVQHAFGFIDAQTVTRIVGRATGDQPTVGAQAAFIAGIARLEIEVEKLAPSKSKISAEVYAAVITQLKELDQQAFVRTDPVARQNSIVATQATELRQITAMLGQVFVHKEDSKRFLLIEEIVPPSDSASKSRVNQTRVKVYRTTEGGSRRTYPYPGNLLKELEADWKAASTAQSDSFKKKIDT